MNLGDVSDLVCVVEFSSELKIVNFNSAFKDLLGTEIEIGSFLLNLIPSYQENSFLSQIEMAYIINKLKNNPQTVVESNWDWHDQNKKNISTIIKVKVFGSNYLCVVENYSTINNKLKKLNSEYFALNESVRNMPQFFFVTDDKGNLKQSNQYFRDFFKIKTTNEYNIYDVFKTSKKYIMQDELYSISEDLFSLDGKENWFKTYSYAILNQDGVPYANGHISIDITKEKELEEEIEQARAQTFSKSKLATLGEMAGGIAHEINNPITVISSLNRIILKSVESGNYDIEKIKKYTSDIENTVVRISKIISGLRNVSRDASQEEYGEFCLGDVLEDVLPLVTEKFRNNNVLLKVDLNSPEYSFKFPCRRIQLSQVFLNLLNNSFDALETFDNKWIEIKCIMDEKSLKLKFIDSGTGIPRQLQEKIFQPFFTTKEIGKGTGLGLSLSNSIISNHGGIFKIDNQCPNTCFEIILPKIQVAKAS